MNIVQRNRKQKKISYVPSILGLMILTLTILVGCANNDGNTSEQTGNISGTLLSVANSTLVASNGVTEYVIPVDSFGRFSATLPVGFYRLSTTGSSSEKIELLNKTIEVVNNTTISLVDADLVPIPLVTSVSASVVNADSAILEWETDIESDGYVEYGINELYGTYSYVTDQQTIMHRVQLMGLQSNTTYHFRIVASRHNIEASQSISKDYVFTTL